MWFQVAAMTLNRKQFRGEDSELWGQERGLCTSVNSQTDVPCVEMEQGREIPPLWRWTREDSTPVKMEQGREILPMWRWHRKEKFCHVKMEQGREIPPLWRWSRKERFRPCEDDQGREILFAWQKRGSFVLSSWGQDVCDLLLYTINGKKQVDTLLVPRAKEKASTVRIISPALALSTRGKETGLA